MRIDDNIRDAGTAIIVQFHACPISATNTKGQSDRWNTL
jgi:hypothetical protein